MSCPERLDQISLTGIRGFGRHGLFPAERELGQTFIADIVLGLELEHAAESDELTATVDYGQLAERIYAVITGDPYRLIETLCMRMVNLCWEYSLVQWVSVTVHKPEAPIAVTFDDVAVTIERSRT